MSLWRESFSLFSKLDSHSHKGERNAETERSYCIGRHWRRWRRWRQASTSPVTTRAVSHSDDFSVSVPNIFRLAGHDRWRRFSGIMTTTTTTKTMKTMKTTVKRIFNWIWHHTFANDKQFTDTKIDMNYPNVPFVTRLQQANIIIIIIIVKYQFTYWPWEHNYIQQILVQTPMQRVLHGWSLILAGFDNYTGGVVVIGHQEIDWGNKICKTWGATYKWATLLIFVLAFVNVTRATAISAK